jgi:antitoxin component YwqK of YwqJK toxin-antitoxin module
MKKPTIAIRPNSQKMLQYLSIITCIFLSTSVGYSQQVLSGVYVNQYSFDIKNDTVYYYDNTERKITGPIALKDGRGNTIYRRQIENGLYSLPRVPVETFQGNYGALSSKDTLIWSSKPFTGIIYKLHSDGSVFWENRWVDGKKEGTWNSWYKNRKMDGTETYAGGMLNGVRTEWHENGVQKRQIFFKDDQPTGIEIIWDSNGVETLNHDLDYLTKHDLDGDDINDTITFDYSGGADCCYTMNIRLSCDSIVRKFPFEMDGGYLFGVDNTQPNQFRIVEGGRYRSPYVYMKIANYNNLTRKKRREWKKTYGIKTDQVQLYFCCRNNRFYCNQLVFVRDFEVSD